jgi:hypothetical protein
MHLYVPIIPRPLPCIPAKILLELCGEPYNRIGTGSAGDLVTPPVIPFGQIWVSGPG